MQDLYKLKIGFFHCIKYNMNMFFIVCQVLSYNVYRLQMKVM